MGMQRPPHQPMKMQQAATSWSANRNAARLLTPAVSAHVLPTEFWKRHGTSDVPTTPTSLMYPSP